MKDTMNKNMDLPAYCGLCCGACSFKVAFDEDSREHIKNMPAKYDQYKNAQLEFCPGCRLDSQRGDCKIRNCAISKGLTHCGECIDFPCVILKEFNDDGMVHHADCIPNLKTIREKGIDYFMDYPEKQWTCTCGARTSWHLKACVKCKKNRDNSYCYK